MNPPEKEKIKNGQKSSKSIFKIVTQLITVAARIVSYTAKKKPWWFLGYLVFYFSAVALPFFTTFYRGRLFDELISGISKHTFISPDIFQSMLVLLGFTALISIVSRLDYFFQYNLDEHISFEIDNDYTAKLAYLDSEYYDDPKTNNLITRVRSKIGMAPVRFLMTIFSQLGEIFRIVISLGILLTVSPILLFIPIAVSLPQAIVNAIYGKRSYRIWDANTERGRDARMTQNRLQGENSLQELKVFRLREYFFNRYLTLQKKTWWAQIDNNNERAYISMFLGLVDVVGDGLVLYFLISQVVSGNITVGLLTFYLASSDRLGGAIRSFFGGFSRLYETSLYMVDIFAFFDLKKIIVSGEHVLPASNTPPIIDIQDMSYRYPGSSKYVIKNLNLTIKPGEHLAIVGENGAGKSTLIKLLLRSYDVSKGAILIDGKDLRDLNLDSWYYLIGSLSQEYNFYHFDAKTNIGVGNIEHLDDFEGIVAAAKMSGAHEFIKDYEKQYDQVLSKSFEGGIDPSMGQKQKIALARAFFNDSPILILDEPTSAIDPKSEYEIFQKLFDFAKGRTVIIISHRFSTVRNADRIIVLDKGEIVEDGTHEKLMKKRDGMYRHAFELQKKGYE